MKTKNIDILGKCHNVTESVNHNLHLIGSNLRDIDISSVGYNNRIVISKSKAFLEAVKSEIGGEIMEDSNIGSFLYYGETTS